MNVSNNKKKKIISVFLVIFLLALVTGITYAVWSNTLTSNQNTITSGVVSMSFTEKSNIITINNALPMADSTGKELTNYFDFNVITNMTINSTDVTADVNYNIIIESLTVDSGYTALTDDQIKVYLEDRTTNKAVVEPILISNLSDSTTGDKLLLATKHTHDTGVSSVTTSYRLRAWIDYNVSANDFKTVNYEYKFRINIDGNINAIKKGVAISSKIKEDNTVKDLATNYNSETIGTNVDKSGLYKYTANGKTDYFYRGYVNNNWVKFGKEEEGTCKYNGTEIAHYFSVNNAHYYGNEISKEECLSTNVCDDGSGTYILGYDQSTCESNNGTYLNEKATWNTTEVKDIYWRIFRINSSNEIRMIYAGNTAPTAATQYIDDGSGSAFIGKSPFNNKNNSAEYVGYQYTLGNAHGTDNDSDIKMYLDAWYESNLEKDYDSYISNSGYCYDRTTYSGTFSGNSYSGDGTGTTNTLYMSGKRLSYDYTNQTSGTPNLVCENENDIYKFKVGLISADELRIAGLDVPHNSGETNNYLVSQGSSSIYWTATANLFGSSSTGLYAVFYSGYYINVTSNSPFGVRPVITMKADTQVKDGTDGTYLHPYEFILD